MQSSDSSGWQGERSWPSLSEKQQSKVVGKTSLPVAEGSSHAPGGKAMQRLELLRELIEHELELENPQWLQRMLHKILVEDMKGKRYALHSSPMGGISRGESTSSSPGGETRGRASVSMTGIPSSPLLSLLQPPPPQGEKGGDGEGMKSLQSSPSSRPPGGTKKKSKKSKKEKSRVLPPDRETGDQRNLPPQLESPQSSSQGERVESPRGPSKVPLPGDDSIREGVVIPQTGGAQVSLPSRRFPSEHSRRGEGELSGEKSTLPPRGEKAVEREIVVSTTGKSSSVSALPPLQPGGAKYSGDGSGVPPSDKGIGGKNLKTGQISSQSPVLSGNFLGKEGKSTAMGQSLPKQPKGQKKKPSRGLSSALYSDDGVGGQGAGVSIVAGGPSPPQRQLRSEKSQGRVGLLSNEKEGGVQTEGDPSSTPRPDPKVGQRGITVPTTAGMSLPQPQSLSRELQGREGKQPRRQVISSPREGDRVVHPNLAPTSGGSHPCSRRSEEQPWTRVVRFRGQRTTVPHGREERRGYQGDSISTAVPPHSQSLQGIVQERKGESPKEAMSIPGKERGVQETIVPIITTAAGPSPLHTQALQESRGSSGRQPTPFPPRDMGDGQRPAIVSTGEEHTVQLQPTNGKMAWETLSVPGRVPSLPKPNISQMGSVSPGNVQWVPSLQQVQPIPSLSSQPVFPAQVFPPQVQPAPFPQIQVLSPSQPWQVPHVPVYPVSPQQMQVMGPPPPPVQTLWPQVQTMFLPQTEMAFQMQQMQQIQQMQMQHVQQIHEIRQVQLIQQIQLQQMQIQRPQEFSRTSAPNKERGMRRSPHGLLGQGSPPLTRGSRGFDGASGGGNSSGLCASGVGSGLSGVCGNVRDRAKTGIWRVRGASKGGVARNRKNGLGGNKGGPKVLVKSVSIG